DDNFAFDLPKLFGSAPLVPGVEAIASVRDAGDGDATGAIGESVIRSVQNHDGGAHFRMNVAEQEANAGVVKMRGIASATFVKAEVEPSSVEQREHVVKERVLVRELDCRANRDNKNVGFEGLVALNDGRSLATRDRTA